MRILRAFWIALRLTASGKPIVTDPYPPLSNWLSVGRARLATVYRTAEAHQWDEARQKAIVLRMAGRDLSMWVILAQIQYHFEQVYPRLMRTPDPHQLTVIYASNMDDSTRLEGLLALAALQDGPLYGVLQDLSAHLAAIPPRESF